MKGQRTTSWTLAPGVHATARAPGSPSSWGQVLSTSIGACPGKAKNHTQCCAHDGPEELTAGLPSIAAPSLCKGLALRVRSLSMINSLETLSQNSKCFLWKMALGSRKWSLSLKRMRLIFFPSNIRKKKMCWLENGRYDILLTCNCVCVCIHMGKHLERSTQNVNNDLSTRGL